VRGVKTALETIVEKFNELVNAVEAHINESECLLFSEELKHYPDLLYAVRRLGKELCIFRYCHSSGCTNELSNCLAGVEDIYERLSAKIGEKMAKCNL